MKAHKLCGPSEEIVWEESANTYHPACRKLAEFLAPLQLTCPFSLNPQQDGPVVFLEENCLRRVKVHARSDMLREQAGILCGHAYEDDGQLYINVTTALPVDTVSDAAHFAFHEASWQKIWPQLDDSSTILGWYHTHPGMGIFLSATDLHTQQQHFASPWQVAMVIDPVSGELGFFYGGKGQPLHPDRFLTYS